MSVIKKKCEICNAEFTVQPYREKTAKYCSLSCRASGTYQIMCERGYGLPVADKSYARGNTFRKGLRPTNAFPKGNTPWNYNIKGIHLSPNTQFRKGSIPANKVAVGTITQRVDKSGTTRNYIKTEEPNVWKAYSVFLWEKEKGTVPYGYVIHHINKNALDDRLDNFDVLTRSEHLLIHREDYMNEKHRVMG